MTYSQRPGQPVVPQGQQTTQQRPQQRRSPATVSMDPNKKYLAQQVPALTQAERARKQYSEFLLKRKIELMVRYLYPAIIRHMKRLDRIMFGEQILRGCAKLYVLAGQAEFNKGMRYKIYNEMDCIQKSVRDSLYLAQSVRAIPTKKYKVASGKFVEIGKILGGLLRGV